MDDMLESLRALTAAAEKSGLDPEVYRFVMQALGHTLEALGEKRHISGNELTMGFRDLLRKQCGPMGSWLLKQWGVKGSMDIGRIVFDLIELNLLKKRDEDTIEDFQEGLDPERDFPESDEVDIDWSLLPISAGGEAL